MKRPCLLEWFLDVFRCLVAEPEDHAVDRASDVGRIFQPATNRGSHPRARFLRRARLRCVVRFPAREPIASLASRSFARYAKRKIQSRPARKQPAIGAKTTQRWRPQQELQPRLLTDSANGPPPKSRPSRIWR